MVGWVNACDSRCFPHGLNGSSLAAIALQSRLHHGHPQMLWAIPPSRGVGRPAREIEELDYCMISVWEKCITTVTAIPVYLVTVCPI